MLICLNLLSLLVIVSTLPFNVFPCLSHTRLQWNHFILLITSLRSFSVFVCLFLCLNYIAPCSIFYDNLLSHVYVFFYPFSYMHVPTFTVLLSNWRHLLLSVFCVLCFCLVLSFQLPHFTSPKSLLHSPFTIILVLYLMTLICSRLCLSFSLLLYYCISVFPSFLTFVCNFSLSIFLISDSVGEAVGRLATMMRTRVGIQSIHIFSMGFRSLDKL